MCRGFAWLFVSKELGGILLLRSVLRHLRLVRINGLITLLTYVWMFVLRLLIFSLTLQINFVCLFVLLCIFLTILLAIVCRNVLVLYRSTVLLVTMRLEFVRNSALQLMLLLWLLLIRRLLKGIACWSALKVLKDRSLILRQGIVCLFVPLSLICMEKLLNLLVWNHALVQPMPTLQLVSAILLVQVCSRWFHPIYAWMCVFCEREKGLTLKIVSICDIHAPEVVEK